MRWVEFDKQIRINKHFIYSSNNIILPKEDALHSIAKNPWIKNIRFTFDGNTDPVYLLSSSRITSCNFEKVDEDGTRLNIGECIQYKTQESFRYENLGQEGLPHGLVNLRIDNIVFKAYIFPDMSSISRDTGNKFIILKGFNSYEIDIVDKDNKDFKITRNNDNIKISDRYSVNKLAEVIPISIKKDGIEILLDIIRPLKRIDRILRGCVLDINQSIPKKLASQYKIRQFDESGVYIHKDKTCSQKYSNKRIQFEINRYVIDRGKDASIESALAFVFWNDLGEIVPLKIASSDIYCQGQYIKHYYLIGVPENKRGYIIQSLEKQKTELTYYEPFPVGFNKRNDKLNFNSKITAINRLQTCIKYGLYIEDFLAPEEINAGLFREYVGLCKTNDNDINFDILWEGALNLNTNWLLIPRTEWQKEIDEGLDPKLVDDLLERYSFFIPDVNDKLTEYLKRFWSYQWTGKITRQSSPERKFVKYIMTGEGETPSQMPEFSGILREMK